MKKSSKVRSAVQNLLDKGVVIPCPFSVEVDTSVNPERIASGVVLHTGCRIYGSKTSIGPGSELGKEGPVALENCQLGRNVELRGGYFSGATFLDGAVFGSAAHVRPGTLLEEEAVAAHAVGLKQTIFLSFVTAGSLINFCDALVAGGTGRRDHSEIGSSYIHFNFTPHQDKATPSLIGDVPRGVFLDRQPIFLGGQGGLVGPARIAYGTVVPAGLICRQDILEENTLFSPLPPDSSGRKIFAVGVYRSIHRIVENNLIYVGNLLALRAWYRYGRIRSMPADICGHACHTGALERIEEGLEERLKRLGELAAKMPHSIREAKATGADLPADIQAQQRALEECWPRLETRLREGPPSEMDAKRDAFLKEWETVDAAPGHINAVKALSNSARQAGFEWLQGIVDWASALWRKP
jgi:UDP-N-acetylglucosamine/UDP-N-acetylgalactosamine diphosphorylase